MLQYASSHFDNILLFFYNYFTITIVSPFRIIFRRACAQTERRTYHRDRCKNKRFQWFHYYYYKFNTILCPLVFFLNINRGRDVFDYSLYNNTKTHSMGIHVKSPLIPVYNNNKYYLLIVYIISIQLMLVIPLYTK